MGKYTWTIQFKAEDYDDAIEILGRDIEKLWSTGVLTIECGGDDEEYLSSNG